MTKKEQLDNIIYDLRLKGTAAFEADDESFCIEKLVIGGYLIEGIEKRVECPNITSVRKEISKLGKSLLWM